MRTRQRDPNFPSVRHWSAANIGPEYSVYVYFVQESCKVLCKRWSRTTSYHHASNGMLERWPKDLHTALSHYINAVNTNCHCNSFFMAQRAHPVSVTGNRAFNQLHRREMQMPGKGNLKVRCL